MNNRYVKKIIEPKELFLMWKDKSGSRHKVGILKKDSFQYLPHDSEDMMKAFDNGFSGFPAFNLDHLEHQNSLSVFMRRCPPKDRRDFDLYLEAFSLDPNSEDVQNISDFTLLGYTGAYVPNNPFNLVNPFSNQEQSFGFVMQVAGAHHNYFKNRSPEDIKVEGKSLSIAREYNNPHDPKAVALSLDGEVFGRIQRGMTDSFIEWIEQERIESINIQRVNGSVEHPYAYAFVQISEKASLT